jgi:parvulin-like peptidyl-prolyl isomerase
MLKQLLARSILAFCFAAIGTWSIRAQDAVPPRAESSDPYFEAAAPTPAKMLQPMAEATEPGSPASADESSAGMATADAAPLLSQDAATARREAIDSLTQPTPTPNNPPQPFEPGRVLALVGGRPILVGDLLLEINQLIEEHAAAAPEQVKQSQRQQLIPRMLPKFVDRELMYVDTVRELPEGADLAKIEESLGTAFDDEALPEILKKSGAQSSLEFDANLRALGSSLRQYRQNWIDDQFVRHFVGQKMQSDDEVSLAELREYYDEHLIEFQVTAKARWEQLTVRFDRVSDRQAARKLIAEMGNKVVYGAPLADIAAQYSQHSGPKDGGDQGWITQGSLAAKSLDQAIFEIPLNELSEIIETPYGFHIVRVLERNEAGQKPFRDAQVEIKRKLVQAKKEKRFEEYVTKLRRDISIEVVDQSIKLPDKYILR